MRRGPLYKKMHFGRSGGSAKFLLRMIALLLLILSAFFLIDSRIRPVICSIAESQARNMVTQAVNDAVLNRSARRGSSMAIWYLSIKRKQGGLLPLKRMLSRRTVFRHALAMQSRSAFHRPKAMRSAFQSAPFPAASCFWGGGPA